MLKVFREIFNFIFKRKRENNINISFVFWFLGEFRFIYNKDDEYDF